MSKTEEPNDVFWPKIERKDAPQKDLIRTLFIDFFWAIKKILCTRLGVVKSSSA